MSCNSMSQIIQASLGWPTSATTTDVLPPEIIERIRQQNKIDQHRQEENEGSVGKDSSSTTSSVTDSTHTTWDSQDSGLSSGLACSGGGPCRHPHGCMRVETLAESMKQIKEPPRIYKRPTYIETLDQGVVQLDEEDKNEQGVEGIIRQDDDKTLESQFPDFAAPPKSVRYDTVEIREHASILGCNPGGTTGPPLTICWKVLNTQILPLDEYEMTRGPRRSVLFLKRSKREREHLLVESGFSAEEIAKAEALAQAIRDSRDESSKERSELQALMRKPSSRRRRRRPQRGVQQTRNQQPSQRRRTGGGLLRGLFRRAPPEQQQ